MRETIEKQQQNSKNFGPKLRFDRLANRGCQKTSRDDPKISKGLPEASPDCPDSPPKRVRNVLGAFRERARSIPRCTQALPICSKGSRRRFGIDWACKMVPWTYICPGRAEAQLTFLCNASLAPGTDLLICWCYRSREIRQYVVALCKACS